MVSMSSGEDFGLIKWPEQKKKKIINKIKLNFKKTKEKKKKSF